MSDLLHVSPPPHKRSPIKTNIIMRDVVIALIPASLFGIYNFGLRALMVIIVTTATCVLTEFLYCKLMKNPDYHWDYSDVITGLLLSLNLTVNIPLWMAAFGGVFAILIVKMVFGGLGQNFMNPAAAARIFLLISFTGKMTSFGVEHGASGLDNVSGATPLEVVRYGGRVDLLKMFIGNIDGCIGETSAIAILIGGGYLLFRKVISLRIPLSYILSFVIFVLIFSGRGFDIEYLLAQILGGGLLLAAVFMATDYVTSPGTPLGKIIFGICLGALTGVFRLFGNSPGGVAYAIVFCNLLVPLIEKLTVPRAFGKERSFARKQL